MPLRTSHLTRILVTGSAILALAVTPAVAGASSYDGGPMGDMPDVSAPEMPGDDMPSDAAPGDDMPSDAAPADDMPSDAAPAEDMPADDDHADDNEVGTGQPGRVAVKKLRVCRRGDGNKDPNGLYEHNVWLDKDDVEVSDDPTTFKCDGPENKIIEGENLLKKDWVDKDGRQVKQALSEARNGFWWVVTYDISVNPRVELSAEKTNQPVQQT